MARKSTKKVNNEVSTEPKIDVAQEVKETTCEGVCMPESAQKQAFRSFIELYKKQHPDKYAQKEAELLAQLNKL